MFNHFEDHWKFPYVPGISLDACKYIHPLKQWDVELINEKLLECPNVKLFVVFGSAVSMRCHSGSDVDIYIEYTGKRGSYKLPPYDNLSGEVDVISNIIDWNTSIGKNIEHDGIIIFDRR